MCSFLDDITDGIYVQDKLIHQYSSRVIFNKAVNNIIFNNFIEFCSLSKLWFSLWIARFLLHEGEKAFWARTFKSLWGPGIDAKEWIPPAFVVWRAGTKTLFLLGA